MVSRSGHSFKLFHRCIKRNLLKLQFKYQFFLKKSPHNDTETTGIFYETFFKSDGNFLQI